MPSITLAKIENYIESTIPDFHQRRLESLGNLKLKKVLTRKNPYLFKAKNIQTAGDLIKNLLDAHLSSQEETILGDFLEGLAIFICSHVFGGRKSAAPGIDLEFERDNIYYIVAIKSGPHWGNSRAIAKMREDFRKAKQTLRTSRSKLNVLSINGCCYGRESAEDKGDYLKLCGQRFWSHVTGIEDLYLRIVKPIGHKAQERNDEFAAEYAKVINCFTAQFLVGFCDTKGAIQWDNLVRFNSGADSVEFPRTRAT